MYPLQSKNNVENLKGIKMAYDPRAVLLTKEDKLAVTRVTDKNRLRGHYKRLSAAVSANLRNKTRGNRKDSE